MQLATKVSAITLGMLALAVWSTLVGTLTANRLQVMLETTHAENLERVRAAQAVRIALLEQRGYVSSYILDGGNPAWLNELNHRRNAFTEGLATVQHNARPGEEQDVLHQLADVYDRYASKRQEVIERYDDNDVDQARAILLGDVSSLYREATGLCDRFLLASNEHINQGIAGTRAQVDRLALLQTGSLLSTVALGSMLLAFFFRSVVLPLRRMAADARGFAPDDEAALADSPDELRQVGLYLQRLMTDVTETRSHLERSRIRLASAEKLAAIGKLASSVAHEIRNPLTAIKMWLFSLRRSIGEQTDALKRLDLVFDEIQRLEDIVRNLLEFSRPPELNLCPHSLAELLDKTLELMHHRLADSQIQVIRRDAVPLPPVVVDPDQLKQVFINLLSNAVEAMPRGGQLHIDTRVRRRGEDDFVVVQVADNGSGMPENVRARIFEPFFTTKDKGTGLGLCIAASIMARHHGALRLEEGQSGSTLAIWIPVKGPDPNG